MLPPAPIPGGRDEFCPHVLIIQVHQDVAPPGEEMLVWSTGKTTGVFYGDDTLTNTELGSQLAQLVETQQGFPFQPHVASLWLMNVSVCSEKGQKFFENLGSRVKVCMTLHVCVSVSLCSQRCSFHILAVRLFCFISAPTTVVIPYCHSNMGKT